MVTNAGFRVWLPKGGRFSAALAMASSMRSVSHGRFQRGDQRKHEPAVKDKAHGLALEFADGKQPQKPPVRTPPTGRPAGTRNGPQRAISSAHAFVSRQWKPSANCYAVSSSGAISANENWQSRAPAGRYWAINGLTALFDHYSRVCRFHPASAPLPRGRPARTPRRPSPAATERRRHTLGPQA